MGLFRARKPKKITEAVEFQSNEAFNSIRLKNLLDYAKHAAGWNPASDQRPLADLIKALTDKLMLSNVFSLLTTEKSEYESNNYYNVLFMPAINEKVDCKDAEIALLKRRERQRLIYNTVYQKPVYDDICVSLALDPVLPITWSGDRLIESLYNIDKTENPWQASSNHFVTMWLPMRISFVNSGNHSIFAGCIKRDGEIHIIPDSLSRVYDISELYNMIEFDGNYYRWLEDNSIIVKAPSFEFGCIFEIGRLMLPKEAVMKDIK